MATRKTTKKSPRAPKKAPVRSFEIVIDHPDTGEFIVRSRESVASYNTLRKAEVAAAIAANAAFQRGEKKVVVLNHAYPVATQANARVGAANAAPDRPVGFMIGL